VTPQVLVDGLSFPEGPRWHGGELWFSDFYTHRVQSVDAAGRVQVRAEVPRRPSGLGFLPDGTLLVVSMVDRRVLAVADGVARPYADLAEFTGGYCNDMIVDAAGRAYVGNFGYEKHAGAPLRDTRLVRIDPDGTVRHVGSALTFPNGMVITPDGKRLIVGETFAHRLTVFDVDAEGDLSNQRVFATIPGCHPDGIALDAEGAVWVADPEGKRALRVFEGGRIAQSIDLAPRGAYACALGGADRRTLYLLTNTSSGPQMAERRDGRIETVRVDVPGAGWP
jgi:sugar lactone lactonase YvrE